MHLADTIIPQTAVHDLGIFTDADLSMRSNVQLTVPVCFTGLRPPRGSFLFIKLCVQVCIRWGPDCPMQIGNFFI